MYKYRIHVTVDTAYTAAGKSVVIGTVGKTRLTRQHSVDIAGFTGHFARYGLHGTKTWSQRPTRSSLTRLGF